MSVKRGVECWITFPDRRFLLLRPAVSPAYGPVTGEIEDGETPFEAALRALEGTGLQFAESGLTLIADDLPVVISPDLTTSTTLYLLRASQEEPMAPMLKYRSERWLRPYEVPAALSLDSHRQTWELIRSHQLSSA